MYGGAQGCPVADVPPDPDEPPACPSMPQRIKPAQGAARCANRGTAQKTGEISANTGAPAPRCRYCLHRRGILPIAPPRHPTTVTLSLLFWLLLPLLFVVAVIDCATMSQPRRVRLLRSAGLSQSAIAERLQISRYRVRSALA